MYIMYKLVIAMIHYMEDLFISTQCLLGVGIDADKFVSDPHTCMYLLASHRKYCSILLLMRLLATEEYLHMFPFT